MAIYLPSSNSCNDVHIYSFMLLRTASFTIQRYVTDQKKKKGKEWGVEFFSSNVMSNNVKLGQGGHSLLAFRVTIDTMLIFFLFILLPRNLKDLLYLNN